MLKSIFKKYPDHEFLTADGLDDAVVGVHEKTLRLIYSRSKCEEIMQEEGMDEQEAREFLEFNTYCAYVGPKTPIWFYDEDDVEGNFDGDICNRDGCMGLIVGDEKEGGCSCHTGNPPCGYCTEQNQYCDTCGWEAVNA